MAEILIEMASREGQHEIAEAFKSIKDPVIAAAGLAEVAKTIAETKANDAEASAEAAAESVTQSQNIFNSILAQYGYPFTAATVADMTDTSKIYVYVGSETGYTNGNWYYYDGTAWVSGGVYNSTAFDTDKTLSIAGMAADASTVGDFIEVGSNLFDANSIEIGKNTLGVTGFPKRALSGVMYVGNQCATIKADVLPPNLKFSVERYSSASASDRIAGSAWITDSTPFYYNIPSVPYIRVFFGSVNDENLTEADFIGLKLSVIKGVSTRSEYEPHKIAIDSTARKKVEVLDVLATQNNPNGILPLSGWEQGSLDANGAEAYATTRIRTAYISVPTCAILKVERRTLAYNALIVEYDASYNFVRSESSYSSSYIHYLGLHPDTAYIRVIARNSPDTTISANDGACVDISVTVDGRNNADFLNVMTYNIGHFGYGTGTGIPDNLYDEKLINYRRFFAEQNCDIVGLQEFDTYIDQSLTKRSNDELFNKLYPYYWDTGSWESLKSKLPLNWRNTKQLSTGRYYVDAYTTINGKVVYLINVHLTVGNSEEAAQTRADEAREIIGLLADKERFVIFGDFNPEPGEEDSLFKIFSDAGYNLANCGWFGKFITWSSNRADLDTDDPPTGDRLYYIDNIITSSNITIENVERLTVFSKLSSDHIPIKARLKIN